MRRVREHEQATGLGCGTTLGLGLFGLIVIVTSAISFYFIFIRR